MFAKVVASAGAAAAGGYQFFKQALYMLKWVVVCYVLYSVVFVMCMFVCKLGPYVPT